MLVTLPRPMTLRSGSMALHCMTVFAWSCPQPVMQHAAPSPCALFSFAKRPVPCTLSSRIVPMSKAAVLQLALCRYGKHWLADGTAALQATRRRCQATSPSTCSCRTPTSSATTAGTALPPTPWPCSTVLTVALTCPARAGTGSHPGLPGSRPGPSHPAATAGQTSPLQHRCSTIPQAP